MLAFVGDFAYRLFEHRILANVNDAIDVHSAPYLQAIKPRLLQALGNPVTIEVMVLLGIFGVLVVHAYFKTLPSKINAADVSVNKTPENTKALMPEVSSIPTSVPIAVGLTFEFAEVETMPDSSPLTYKFKLRVYLANYSGETIHLGAPEWLEGIAPQGGHLTYSYQLRQPQNLQKPWGDELKEVDVSAGRRCRIWLGLDPARREDALKLLDKAELGLLIIPVSTNSYSANVRIRPSDRGLRRIAAKDYDAIKKAAYDRYINQSQMTKALLEFVCARRVVSAQQLVDHFQHYRIPDAAKTLSDLRNDPFPFLVTGTDIRLTPALEKIIVETVRADEAEFRQAYATMTPDVISNRKKNESGFEGRVNALFAGQPL